MEVSVVGVAHPLQTKTTLPGQHTYHVLNTDFISWNLEQIKNALVFPMYIIVISQVKKSWILKIWKCILLKLRTVQPDWKSNFFSSSTSIGVNVDGPSFTHWCLLRIICYTCPFLSRNKTSAVKSLESSMQSELAHIYSHLKLIERLPSEDCSRGGKGKSWQGDRSTEDRLETTEVGPVL